MEQLQSTFTQKLLADLMVVFAQASSFFFCVFKVLITSPLSSQPGVSCSLRRTFQLICKYLLLHTVAQSQSRVCKNGFCPLAKAKCYCIIWFQVQRGTAMEGGSEKCFVAWPVVPSDRSHVVQYFSSVTFLPLDLTAWLNYSINQKRRLRCTIAVAIMSWGF